MEIYTDQVESFAVSPDLVLFHVFHEIVSTITEKINFMDLTLYKNM